MARPLVPTRSGRSTKKAECCVCFHHTAQVTACGHSLCRRCARRLKRKICPYCRQELPAESSLPENEAMPSFGSGAVNVRLGEISSSSQAAGLALQRALDELRDCSNIAELHEVVLAFAPTLVQQPPTSRMSFTTMATKRCCILLRGEWNSLEHAEATLPFLSGLRENAHFDPLRDVQLAIVDAMLMLLGASPTQKSQSRPRSASLYSTRRTHTGGVLDTEMTLLRWVRYCKLFSSLAVADLLPLDCLRSLAGILTAELRKLIQDWDTHDMNLAAPLLSEGQVWLDRGVQRVAPTSSASSSDSVNATIKSGVGDIVHSALGAIERREIVAGSMNHIAMKTASSNRAATRDALQAVGVMPPAVSDESYIAKQNQPARPFSARGASKTRPGSASTTRYQVRSARSSTAQSSSLRKSTPITCTYLPSFQKGLQSDLSMQSPDVFRI